MEIHKNVTEITLPIIATSGYFISNGAIDYGYIVESNLVLPFYIKKNLIFRILLFPTGILGNNSKEDQQFFLDKLIVFVRNNFKVDFILMQHTTSLFNAFPKESIACRFGSYILDLSATEEELFSGLHSKHRNVIKKAIKDGIVITKDARNIEDCIHLIQETLVRQGVVFQSSDFFNQLSQNLGENVDFWIAENDSKIQGAAIIVWNKGANAYYLYGGSAIEPHTGAMNLLHWEVIKTMKLRGVLFYDFVGARLNPKEGSKYEGIQRFKSRFGGDLKEGYLWKISINKAKYNLYFNALKIKCYLKGIKYSGDIIDQELERIGI